jgi:ABC-type multidrug transport system permease subunit
MNNFIYYTVQSFLFLTNVLIFIFVGQSWINIFSAGLILGLIIASIIHDRI